MEPRLEQVVARLERMERDGPWPRGPRYLWTDAFGLVLLLSVHRETGEDRWLARARWLADEVERVLGCPRGLRIGEGPHQDGQYYHYVAMWLYALGRLAEHEPARRARAVELARDVHRAFVRPEEGVVWKMHADLSEPWPGSGYGALDPYHGFVVYRLLDPRSLQAEIADLEAMVERDHDSLTVDQDLGLGMMLWMTQFFPEEDWARVQRARSLRTLDAMWVDPPGWYCRHPELRGVHYAFANHGISIGLQAVGARAERVATLRRTLAQPSPDDPLADEGITHVMGCCALWPGLLLREPVPAG